MATAWTLPDDVLTVIADQIGDKLSESAQQALAAGQTLEIGESFPVWMLPLAETADPENALMRGAVNTGYWHHQIRYGGRAKEFAKSRPVGPTPRDWIVEEVATSPVAEKMEVTIGLLDKEVTDDVQVRYLIIPAYIVHAFWISDRNSRLVLIHKPDSVTGLEQARLYSASDFLRRLAQQPYVIGVPPMRPC